MTQQLRGLAAAVLLSGSVVLKRAFQLVAPEPPLSPPAQALKEAILKILDQTIRNEYGIGLLFRKLVDDQLYTPYPSALAWWDAQLPGDVGARTAERYYRLTRFFGQQTFRIFGVVRLELVVRWCSMRSKEVPEDPSQVPITWVVGGKEVTKPFSECSMEDMLAAVHPHHSLPQPGSHPDKIDKRLPEWTQKFIALVQNRLHDYMNGELGTLELVVAWHRKEPSYSLMNVGESELFAVIDILNKTADELGGRPSQLPRSAPARRKGGRRADHA
jgi:hypothetical protein